MYGLFDGVLRFADFPAQKVNGLCNVEIRMSSDLPFDGQKTIVSDFAQRVQIIGPVDLSFSKFHFAEEFAGFRNKLVKSPFGKGVVDPFRVAVAQMNAVFRMGVNDVFR